MRGTSPAPDEYVIALHKRQGVLTYFARAAAELKSLRVKGFLLNIDMHGVHDCLAMGTVDDRWSIALADPAHPRVSRVAKAGSLA